MSPQLVALQVADPVERWAELGFAVAGGSIGFEHVELQVGKEGDGIVGWTLSDVDAEEIDGLRTTLGDFVVNTTINSPRVHPNGVTGIDHVVLVTPDFDRTAAALEAAGLGLSRTREAGEVRQGFRRLGPVIMELVAAPQVPSGPARFWGLTFTVRDLDALAGRLGSHLGEIRPAVQPGRRIATLDRSAGLSPQVAFMTAE